MNKIILALLLTFSLGASAQYSHRSNPSDLSLALPSITSVGAGNCPGTGCVVLSTAGTPTAIATVAGTYVATYLFYGSNDNFVTLTPLLGYPLSSGLLGVGVLGPAANATGTWVIPSLGFRAVAVYASAWTSNASGTIRLDADPALTTTVSATAAPVTGTLATITTDKVTLPISGGQWATAKFTVTTAGTATATAQISIDGGYNYIASAYAKRLSTVAANPTVQAITSTTLVTGDVWEVPLPANATHFQLLCGASGTTTTVSLSGGALYVPGVPVAATLYDVTEGGIGAGLNTGTMDVSGWKDVLVQLTTPTTQVWTYTSRDETGAIVGPGWVTSAASSATVALSMNSGTNGLATVAAGAFTAYPLLEKRIGLQLSAGGTVSQGRARVVVHR